MKIESKLARVFSNIGEHEAQTESTAAQILGIIKQGKVKDIEAWNALVAAAYEVNGWNQVRGRPMNGEVKLKQAPTTVQSYVALVRQAIRIGLKLLSYGTFYEVRRDLKAALEKKREKLRRQIEGPADEAVPDGLAESFVGVKVAALGTPNGALFHDLASTYVKLPQEHRDVLGRQLSRLLHKYLPLVPEAPAALPAPARQRKAA